MTANTSGTLEAVLTASNSLGGINAHARRESLPEARTGVLTGITGGERVENAEGGAPHPLAA